MQKTIPELWGMKEDCVLRNRGIVLSLVSVCVLFEGSQELDTGEELSWGSEMVGRAA